MSTTIMMPAQLDAAIREMCSDAMSQVVDALAAKYGFDAEEAHRFIEASEVKLARKRGPATKESQVAAKKVNKKAAKSDDDQPKPKKAKTGYLLYADQVREEVRTQLKAELEEGEKLKPQDVVKAIGAKWKAESQDVQAEWKAKAAALKDAAEPVAMDEEE